LGLRTKKKVADKLFHLGVRKITFAGGEPLLDSDTFEMVKYVSKKGIKTALCTNGYLLSRDLLSRLDTYLNELTVPLDGSNSRTHGSSRGSEESFAVSMRLLRIANGFNVNMDVSTVVSKCNARDLSKMLGVVLESGVTKWKLFQFYPLGRGLHNRDRFEISQEEFKSLAEELEPYRSVVEMDVRSSDNETMLSYFHISPNGRMLLVDRHEYRDIGSFLGCDDIPGALVRNRFHFRTHSNRHWRDS
jgi:radical S-adenosyl methionine domain-containing protein 2